MARRRLVLLALLSVGALCPPAAPAGAEPKSAKLASFNLTLAAKSLGLGAGQRTIKLKPGRKLLGSPHKPFKVRVRVTATDAAGDAATTTRTISVKPPKPA
jgi:hypothetical protein